MVSRAPQKIRNKTPIKIQMMPEKLNFPSETKKILQFCRIAAEFKAPGGIL